MTTKRTIFLSDLHIGANATTNMYQPEIHQPYLKAILRHIQDPKNRINDLVILGDWLEYALYCHDQPPAAIQDIFARNEAIFTPQADGSGDFVTCLQNISGNFYYVNGNHDADVTLQELNTHFSRFVPGKPVLPGNPGAENPHANLWYESENVYAAHGHVYSFLNKLRDNMAGAGAGRQFCYYLCRLAASMSAQTIQNTGAPNAAYLASSGVMPPLSGLNVLSAIKYLWYLLSGKICFAAAIYFAFIEFTRNEEADRVLAAAAANIRLKESALHAILHYLVETAFNQAQQKAQVQAAKGTDELRQHFTDLTEAELNSLTEYFDRDSSVMQEYRQIPVVLDGQQTITVGAAIDAYEKMWTGCREDYQELAVDMTASLNTPARALCREHRIVIMGHTHKPEMISGSYLFKPFEKKWVYVNSGFLVPDLPSFRRENTSIKAYLKNYGKREPGLLDILLAAFDREQCPTFVQTVRKKKHTAVELFKLPYTDAEMKCIQIDKRVWVKNG